MFVWFDTPYASLQAPRSSRVFLWKISRDTNGDGDSYFKQKMRKFPLPFVVSVFCLDSSFLRESKQKMYRTIQDLRLSLYRVHVLSRLLLN